ncbi:hypothetical protein QZH41_005004 [Actinostola sp. cb2023]|nr:hypothetical protein QZH41_005004 [Actinostola sp. cb2023]
MTNLEKQNDKAVAMAKVEICNNPRSPVNGYKRGKRVSLSGDKVTFYCDSKYDFVGSKEMFCDKGIWNGSVPRCLGRCRVPNYFGKVKTDSIALRSGAWIKHDTKLTFYCNFGQELVGGNKTVCNNGHWSNAFPECKGDCVAPRAIDNGYKTGNDYRHGKWILFGCNVGYRLKGKKYLNCDDGQWNGEIPTCIEFNHWHSNITLTTLESFSYEWKTYGTELRSRWKQKNTDCTYTQVKKSLKPDRETKLCSNSENTPIRLIDRPRDSGQE